MKIPGMKEIDVIARAIAVAGSVKESIIDKPKSESESELLKIIRKQEDDLHDKKAEICKLREKIEQLQEEINYGKTT